MSRLQPEAGFSLVETLVSLAVIAGMSGVLFEAIGTNARAARQVAQKREAILLARSLLAHAVVPPGTGELADAGQSGGFSWRFSRHGVGGGARDSGVPLQEVRIHVFDRETGRQLVDVRTLRLER